MAEICVIGAGPAGSTFAARMAQLGHSVCIVEKASFPRSHLGESLSPGVLPLLETTGVREAVERAGFQRVRRVLVKWDGELQVREDEREQGMLVDRGEFDRLLLERARELGVRVLQPARVSECERSDRGWTLCVEANGSTFNVHADFLADAGGRSGFARNRGRTGCRTLALYAYWRGPDFPREPRIEAGADAWYWGVPLPDGSYNTLVFVDVDHFRATRTGSITTHFLELLARSGLIADVDNARLDGPVRAIDATPYLGEDSVTLSSIRVGEAALAIDPISSSGVQKAIQSALSAAVVANTLLRRSGSGELAMRFYRSSLAEASERHSRWAESHYGLVTASQSSKFQGSKFWQDRGSRSKPESPQPSPTPVDIRRLARTAITLSRDAEIMELPCIEGDFVTVKPALRHPNLDGPLAYLSGWEVAPLLQRLPVDLTLAQLAQAWSGRIPLQSGLAIAGWLFQHGLLIEKNPTSWGPPLHDFSSGVTEDTRP